jgi:predicted Zn-dependent peptidase
MNYIDITPFIHIINQPLDRKKTEIEIILSSAGSWFEVEQDRGRRHLLEHCILSRTSTMSFQELKDFNFREGIYMNAYTGAQTMGFEASGHRSDFKKMVDLLLEVVFTPTFDQGDLDREKEIVLREISERRGDPNYKLHFEVMREVFTAKSSDNHEVLGSAEQVASTKIEDFTRMHMENLDKSHVFICLNGGGIDVDYVKETVHQKLKKNEVKNHYLQNKDKLPIEYDLPSEFNYFEVLPVVNELAHAHAEVTLYIPMPNVNFDSEPTLTLFNSLFLKYGGVLYDRLRDELGLVYGISSSFSENHQMLIINFSSEIKYINQIVDETKKTFADFAKYYNPSKFEEFKTSLFKKQELSEDAPGSVINFTLRMLQKYNKFESFESYNTRIKAVTQDQIKEIYNLVNLGNSKIKAVIVSKDESIKNIKL